MNVLVTGGAGYIGSITCKELKRRGYSVFVYDNLSNSQADYAQWGELIVGDVNDQELLTQTLQKHAIEGVFHFAGAIEVGESKTNPMKYFLNNIVGTYNLLAAIRRAGVKHAVFSSTCATYGNAIRVPLDENGPQQPVSVYGETKLMCEKMFRELTNTSDLCAVMLRYFNASGADPDGESGERHNPETHLLPLVIRAALDPAFELKVFGDDYPTPDGTCIRDYTHVTDLAEAHVLAFEWSRRTKAKFDAFNLGSGEGSSVREVIRCVEKHLDHPVKHRVHPRREGDPPILVADISKARRTLGWSPRLSTLDKVVSSACQWHQSERFGGFRS
jgi:UDP-glucose-4-epimerase GalE